MSARQTRTATQLFIAVLAILSPHTIRAQPDWESVQEGNTLYAQGEYAAAHEKYQEALSEAPGEALIRFNDGSALYRSEHFEAATKSYTAATLAPQAAVASRAWYNLGNTFFKREDFDLAIDAYKQALRIHPDDRSAKHNLEVALQERAIREAETPPPPKNETQGRSQDRSKDSSDPQAESGASQSDMREALPPARSPQRLTPAEAEDWLKAIQEDPNRIKRQLMAPTGNRPEKNW